MRKRVAGILRVKNDGAFIEDCVESCISALDELIIVYNDCTDNSAEEIEKMARQYPDKIRFYEYPHRVLAFNLNRDEFEAVKELSEDSPYLFSSYCNFALSKVTADYAMVIDADQIYFTDSLKSLLDFVRDCDNQTGWSRSKVLIGKLFRLYVSAYWTLSRKIGVVAYAMLPQWLVDSLYPYYYYYARYAFSRDEVCLSLSGVNVLETDETLISMGHPHPSGLNVIPAPFNGTGDHLIFRMSDNVKFRKYVMDAYNPKDGEVFCVAEEFTHPYKRLAYVGFYWKHIRTSRLRDKYQVLDAYNYDRNAFLDISSFKKLSYRKILKSASRHIFLPENRILFGFVYKANKRALFDSLDEEIFGGAIKKTKRIKNESPRP